MNLEALNKKITESRIPVTAIADTLGFSRQSFYNKIKGKRDFKTQEILKLCELLKLTESEKAHIFFEKEGDA